MEPSVESWLTHSLTAVAGLGVAYLGYKIRRRNSDRDDFRAVIDELRRQNEGHERRIVRLEKQLEECIRDRERLHEEINDLRVQLGRGPNRNVPVTT